MFSAAESTAAEGQFYGGDGGRSEETEACFPLHWRTALCKTEETNWRVSDGNIAAFTSTKFFQMKLNSALNL